MNDRRRKRVRKEKRSLQLADGLHISENEKLPRLLRLQEAHGASENGLGFAQAVHLLVERSLAGVEVVEREVAALVEVRVLVHELLLLVQRSGECFLLRHLVRLSRRLLLALVGDV